MYTTFLLTNIAFVLSTILLFVSFAYLLPVIIKILPVSSDPETFKISSTITLLILFFNLYKLVKTLTGLSSTSILPNLHYYVLVILILLTLCFLLPLSIELLFKPIISNIVSGNFSSAYIHVAFAALITFALLPWIGDLIEVIMPYPVLIYK
jgi:hypothetical protein